MSESERINQSLPALQALLFVSGEPVTHTKISHLLNLTPDETKQAISALGKVLEEQSHSGLMLIEQGEEVEMATQSRFATLLEEFTKSSLQENLSKAALEVLSIVAYRSPITRSSLEAIRGVNCSFTLRNLLMRGLITRETNPDDTREYVYAPSLALLEKLGLRSVNDLPQFAELSKDARLDQLVTQSEAAESTPQS